MLDDDLQRQPHQRAHIGGHDTVGARNQHHLVLRRQAGHDLGHARVAVARVAFDPLQQRHFGRRIETDDRVLREIQRATLVAARDLRTTLAALTRNGARSLGGGLQRWQADVVRVGECGLLAADGAHTHALFDVEAARLDDALLQAPAFAATVLEVQVGVVDLVRQDLTEHSRQPARVESVRRQQGAVGGGK